MAQVGEKKEEGMAAARVSMKLLIDTQSKRVLFAEAGKDCIDFLFHILTLPVATIIRLLVEEGMEGSWPNLYQSLEDLNNCYIQPHQSKDIFLKPLAPLSSFPVPLLILNDAPTEKKFYKCGHCATSNFSDNPRALCPSCHRVMNVIMVYVDPPAVNLASEGGGFVKGVVTYMVMDDLVVKPLSTISSIALLNKFNVKDVGTLEEKVVDLGMKEALKLLKASHHSKNALTEVFC